MTRRRLRYRLAAVVSGLMVATLGIVAGSASVSAGGPGTFIDMGSYWKDPICGSGNELFVARIWKDVNYQGESWKFCSNWSDLCWVPHGQDSSSALRCANGVANTSANDKGSSIKVSSIGGGASCWLEVRDDRNYGGARWRTWDPINVASWVPWPNDESSSIRRYCP